MLRALSGDAAHTNFIVIALTRSGLEPMIYRTRGEQAITPPMRLLPNKTFHRQCLSCMESISFDTELSLCFLLLQPKCTEVQRSRTNDCRWPAGLDMADQIIERGRIAAYKIQWFSGAWSGWFVPGVNDLSTKFNTHPRTCSLSYRAKSMRRRWAMFYDRTHKFIICKPQ
jgi:hypothetical protein